MFRCPYDGKVCETASWYGDAIYQGQVSMVGQLCRRCWRASKARGAGSPSDRINRTLHTKNRPLGDNQVENRR